MTEERKDERKDKPQPGMQNTAGQTSDKQNLAGAQAPADKDAHGQASPESNPS